MKDVAALIRCLHRRAANLSQGLEQSVDWALYTLDHAIECEQSDDTTDTRALAAQDRGGF